jgi:hypothetical protein
LVFDSNVGEYLVKIGGVIELPTPAVDASANNTPSSSTGEPLQSASETTSNGTATEANPNTGKPSNFNFGINILQSVGTQFGLPTSGVLRMVMKDGTTSGHRSEQGQISFNYEKIDEENRSRR